MASGQLLWRFFGDARGLTRAAREGARALDEVGDSGEEAGERTVESTTEAETQIERLEKAADKAAGALAKSGKEGEDSGNKLHDLGTKGRAAMTLIAAAAGVALDTIERFNDIIEGAASTLKEVEDLSFRTGLDTTSQGVFNELARAAGAEPEELAEGLLAFRERIQLGTVPEEDLVSLGITTEFLQEKYAAGELANAVQVLDLLFPLVQDLIAARGPYEAQSALETLASTDSRALFRVIDRGVTFDQQLVDSLTRGSLIAPEEIEYERSRIAQEAAIQAAADANIRGQARVVGGAREHYLEARSEGGFFDVFHPRSLLGFLIDDLDRVGSYFSEIILGQPGRVAGFEARREAPRLGTVPFLTSQEELARLVEEQVNKTVQPVIVNVEGSVVSSEDLSDTIGRSLGQRPGSNAGYYSPKVGLP